MEESIDVLSRRLDSLKLLAVGTEDGIASRETLLCQLNKLSARFDQVLDFGLVLDSLISKLNDVDPGLWKNTVDASLGVQELRQSKEGEPDLREVRSKAIVLGELEPLLDTIKQDLVEFPESENFLEILALNSQIASINGYLDNIEASVKFLTLKSVLVMERYLQEVVNSDNDFWNATADILADLTHRVHEIEKSRDG